MAVRTKLDVAQWLSLPINDVMNRCFTQGRLHLILLHISVKDFELDYKECPLLVHQVESFSKYAVSLS